ncbi:MAG: S8 family serine peptidase, partial [Acidobacteria bacterium]|nr:S8 family serine peptidase [Acidobacteriota bacterium]
MPRFPRDRRVLLMTTAAAAVAALFLVLGFPIQLAQKKLSGIPSGHLYAKFSRADALSSEIRKRSVELARVEVRRDADRDAITKFGSIVQDFGTFLVVAREKNTSSPASNPDIQPIDSTINLPGAKFDPILSEPKGTVVDPRAGVEPPKGYYIVQFGGLATDEWLNSLRDAGVEVLQYVPHNAFFVYGDGQAIAKAAAHSRVRWVGEYLSEQKVPQLVKESFAGRTASAKTATRIVDVAVFSRANLREARDRLTDSGGRLVGVAALPNNFFNIVRIEISVDKLNELAAVPEVIRIDPFFDSSKDDERSSQIVAGNYSGPETIAGPSYDPANLFGVDGTNVTVAVSDDGVGIPGNGGFYLTAANTRNAPLRGAAEGASTGHGHLNATIIAGSMPHGTTDPRGYVYGRGIAPGANIINIPWLRFGYPRTDPGSDARAIDDAMTTPGPNGFGASISNHSWSAGVNQNAYDSYAALYDGLVLDGTALPSIDPMSIIFSAGNCGLAPNNAQCNPSSSGGGSPQTGIGRPKVAKNIITVGNSENLRTELSSSANNIDDLAGSSSRGPAADGRIKPDIVAPGTVITGGRAGTDCSGVSACFEADHSWSSGTSHAAPQIAGAAALFTQHWRNRNFDLRPSPAMIKAAILNSGQEMNGVNTSGASVPNGDEGWGRINMKFVIDASVPTKQIDNSPLSAPGESFTLNGSVANSSKQVRVSLVWSDPPAAGDPALVNNLDLTVVVGDATYRGNVFALGRSTSGGASDAINNVEHVWLPAGLAAGTPYSITVRASGINGDGIRGNDDSTDQSFALVAYNYTEAPPAASYSMSGQVLTPQGRGVANVFVTFVDSTGTPRYALTNPLGYYRFLNVASNQSYTVHVLSKRYDFPTQSVLLTSNN